MGGMGFVAPIGAPEIAYPRVLALVKALLKAGILTELGGRQDTHTGTPQGGILTPPTQWAM